MEEALIKRTMPNNIEAEQSVIGAMMMDRKAIIAASETLMAEDFYHNQYAVLFDSILELFNQNQPVDFITLQNKLKEKDLPPEISSLEYINDPGDIRICDFCFTPAPLVILQGCFNAAGIVFIDA